MAVLSNMCLLSWQTLLLSCVFCYELDVTVHQDGLEERMQFEVVSEDVPPFDINEDIHTFETEERYEGSTYNVVSAEETNRSISTIRQNNTNNDNESSTISGLPNRTDERHIYLNLTVNRDDLQNVSVKSSSNFIDLNGTNVREGVKITGILGNSRRRRSVVSGEDMCLRFKSKKSMDKAVFVERGETVQMPCHMCGNINGSLFEASQWIKLHTYPNSEGLYHIHEVIPDMHNEKKRNRISTGLDHTLTIRRVGRSDAGSYFCRSSEDASIMNKYVPPDDVESWIMKHSKLRFFFHLDVLDLQHARTIDVSSDSVFATQEPEIVPPMNIRVTTEWHEWSECSVCGELGMRKRIGLCMVKKSAINETVPHSFLNNILTFSPEGLPCQSEYLAGFADKIWRSRPNEIQLEQCNVPCRSASRRKRSLSKSELWGPGKKKTVTKTVQVGHYLMMRCPGASITKMPNWVRGTKYVPLAMIKKNSNKRITFDLFGNLHFSIANISDSGTYSCWRKKKMKKSYELKVTPNKSEEIKNYMVDLAISFAVDFAVFLLLAGVKFASRKIQTRKKV